MYIRGYFEDNWFKLVIGGVSLYEKIIRDNKKITTIFAGNEYYTISVSYTHLDVYKRQPITSTTSLTLSGTSL